LIWFFLFVLLSPVEWIAAGKNLVKVRAVTKPLSLFLLILWFSCLGGWQQGWLFGLGLVFSLAGDVFLLLSKKMFIFGLFAFLTAHICYIAGFLLADFSFSSWFFVPLLFVLGYGIFGYIRIIREIRKKQEYRRLGPALILYLIMILVMLFTALTTWFRPSWGFWGAFMASLGAFAFTVSDSMLAFRRFLRYFRFARFLVMFTYHLGQLGITTGALIWLKLL